MKKVVNVFYVIIAAFVLVTAITTGYKVIMHIIYPVRYFEHIHKYAIENRLDEYLVMGVIKAESNFIYDAHSGVATGLMQLTDETASWVSGKMGIEYEKEDLLVPEKNIKMGCYYLRYLIDHYGGNIDVALAAYNAGMGNVKKWLSDSRYSKDGESLDNIPFEETRNYVKRVGEYYDTYKKLYRLNENLK